MRLLEIVSGPETRAEAPGAIVTTLALALQRAARRELDAAVAHVVERKATPPDGAAPVGPADGAASPSRSTAPIGSSMPTPRCSVRAVDR